MNLASAPSWPIQAAAPRCSAAVSPGTVFSSSTPTHQRGPVGAGPQIGDRGQGRDAARGACGLVARRRRVPQPLVHGGGHRAEVALAGEQLTEGVGDMHDVDRGGVQLRGGERGLDHFGGQIGEIEALPGQVAAEVALVAAEDPDIGGAAHDRDDTTTNRVTRADGSAREGGPAGSRSEPTRPQWVWWSTAAPTCSAALPTSRDDKRHRPMRCVSQDRCALGVIGNTLAMTETAKPRSGCADGRTWPAPPLRRAVSRTCFPTSPQRRRS